MSTVYTAPSAVHAAAVCPVAEAFGRPFPRETDDGRLLGVPTMHFACPEPTPDDVEARYAAAQQAGGDSQPPRCIRCRCEDSGNEIGGVHVPLCDRCLANSTALAVGLPMMRDVVEEFEQEEGDDWRAVRAENEARRVAMRRRVA